MYEDLLSAIEELLDRKLDEALKSDREREMLAIKVNYLDGEIRKMKEPHLNRIK